MFSIQSIGLTPILLLSPQCVEQGRCRTTLSVHQVGDHMLGQLPLVFPLGSQFGLLGNNRQDVVG